MRYSDFLEVLVFYCGRSRFVPSAFKFLVFFFLGFSGISPFMVYVRLLVLGYDMIEKGCCRESYTCNLY